MKSVRLGDLRDLLQSQEFAAWWTGWQHAGAAVRDARARHEELLSQSELMAHRSEVAQRAAMDAFSRAGEAEDEGARSTAEAHAHENRALELVGEFEEQRFRTSDLWIRLGGAEKTLEERREPPARGARNGATARGAKAALRAAERQHQVAAEQYAAADEKRGRLWKDVERAWGTSFERSLLGAEHALVARRLRRDAERLFAEAEERRVRAKRLAGEAERAARELREAEDRRAALLAAAREKLGCVPGTSFLYWRHKDDQRSAFALALADDPEGANIEVKALGIYAVGRQRGVAFLEPARDGLVLTAEEGDRRFEEYFLGPRKGVRREEEAGSSQDDPGSR